MRDLRSSFPELASGNWLRVKRKGTTYEGNRRVDVVFREINEANSSEGCKIRTVVSSPCAVSRDSMNATISLCPVAVVFGNCSINNTTVFNLPDFNPEATDLNLSIPPSEVGH